MIKKQNKFLCYCLMMLLFSSGCGIFSILGTPSASEQKIKAEFPLTYNDEKILVFVDQPSWLGAPMTLRDMVSDQINRNLIQLAKVSSNQIIPYRTLADFRSKRDDFSILSPAEVGNLLGADLLLLIQLDIYNLSNIEDTNYYKGSLWAHAVLIETKSGKQLWPSQSGGKNILIGFEVARISPEDAVSRLATGLSHCVTRYFYDCPYKKFKIADDRTNTGFDSWENLQF